MHSMSRAANCLAARASVVKGDRVTLDGGAVTGSFPPPFLSSLSLRAGSGRKHWGSSHEEVARKALRGSGRDCSDMKFTIRA